MYICTLSASLNKICPKKWFRDLPTPDAASLRSTYFSMKILTKSLYKKYGPEGVKFSDLSIKETVYQRLSHETIPLTLDDAVAHFLCIFVLHA